MDNSQQFVYNEDIGPLKRDRRHNSKIKKQPLCIEINRVYERIKGSKDFNVYYNSLHDLLKQFFTQEYTYSKGPLPYPGFDEEMVEDFLINWQRQGFSLKAREKKNKDYKTLSDKLSSDEVKRASYYLNLYEYRKKLCDFDKYTVPLEENLEYVNSLIDDRNKYQNLDELVGHELKRLYSNNLFVEDKLNFCIFVFISMFLGSFDIEYIAANLYQQLSKDDFLLNAVKSRVCDAVKRIERRLDDIESNEEVCASPEK